MTTVEPNTPGIRERVEALEAALPRIEAELDKLLRRLKSAIASREDAAQGGER